MNPVNHGKIWDAAFYTELLLNFWNGRSIDEIAKKIGRKKDSVISKLTSIRLGQYNLNGDFIEEKRDAAYVSALIAKFIRQMAQNKGTFVACYSDDVKRIASLWINDNSIKYLTSPEISYIRSICNDSVPVLQFEGETEMPKFFENNYLLNGKSLAAMSDSDIYAAIAAEEQAVNNLRQISHKPKRLEKEIYNRSKSLKEFIEFLDKLDEPKEE